MMNSANIYVQHVMRWLVSYNVIPKSVARRIKTQQQLKNYVFHTLYTKYRNSISALDSQLTVEQIRKIEKFWKSPVGVRLIINSFIKDIKKTS